jgi:hypothetical protein
MATPPLLSLEFARRFSSRRKFEHNDGKYRLLNLFLVNVKLARCKLEIIAFIKRKNLQFTFYRFKISLCSSDFRFNRFKIKPLTAMF